MKHSNREDIEAEWQAPRNLETPAEAQEDLDDDEVPGNRTTRAIPCCVLFTAVVLGFVFFGWQTLASVKDMIWQKYMDQKAALNRNSEDLGNMQQGLVDEFEKDKALLEKVQQTQQQIDEIKDKVDTVIDTFNQPTQ